MLNVQALTQTLSAMPLNQLQQYAQLHRNDPYVVTMALSIANQKKQAMAAQQGQAGMQPQPKVVDSEIAQMAPQAMPEGTGIGQLPAGNMNFADGGIVGYADGGDVERYQSGGMSFIDRLTYGNITPAERARREKLQAEANARRLPTPYERERAANMAAVTTGSTYTPEAYGVTTPAPLEQGARYPGAMPAAPAAPAVDNKAAPIADTARRAGPGVGPGAAPRTEPPAAGGLGDLATLRQDILNKQQFTDPASVGLKELEARELAAAQEDKASLLRDQSKFEDAFKGREKRLSDRELDIGKQKDANTGLAFLNAGLAIMSTPGGLATAIGKGAQVGTAQFAAGLDKIRSAQERLDDARDKMEDLKLNRAEMSAKEIRAAEKGIRNVGVDAQKRTIDGIRMAADVNEKRATDIYKSTVDVGVNRERLASAENIAGMQERGASARSAAQIAAQLNTPDRLVFDKLLKDNNNDPVKALEAFKLAKGDKFDLRTHYAEHIKDAAKAGMPIEPLAKYAAYFGATLPR